LAEPASYLTTIVDPAAPAGLEVMQRPPSPRLRGVVRDLCGYVEQTGSRVRRRELPSADVVFIVNLGEPLLVEQPRGLARLVPSGGGFIAGLHETYALTETAGSQWGIEIRLPPLSAYRISRQPMADLSNRSVGLDEVFGSWAVDLCDRLREARTWQARFAILESAVDQRLDDALIPAPEIVWAWGQLTRSGGRVAVGTLASELGWSPKRLIAGFREQIGLPPKQTARLLRFQRAAALLAADEPPDRDEMALRCGYYDQSHLINEFRRFAGDTPDGLVRRELALGEGYAAD
jgi:AraC-like DNA-binding protein